MGQCAVSLVKNKAPVSSAGFQMFSSLAFYLFKNVQYFSGHLKQQLNDKVLPNSVKDLFNVFFSSPPNISSMCLKQIIFHHKFQFPDFLFKAGMRKSTKNNIFEI